MKIIGDFLSAVNSWMADNAWLLYFPVFILVGLFIIILASNGWQDRENTSKDTTSNN